MNIYKLSRFILLLLVLSILMCSCVPVGDNKEEEDTTEDMSKTEENDTGVISTEDETEKDTEESETSFPLEGENVINVIEIGLVPNDLSAANANNETINRVIAQAKEGSVIYFPKGDYYISSNIGCIQLVGKADITLYGPGATIINTTYNPEIENDASHYMDSLTLVLNGCNNVKVSGLGFDYYRYVQVCGTVLKRNYSEIVLDIDEKFTSSPSKAPLNGNEYIMAVAVLDGNGGVTGDHYASNEGYLGKLNSDGTYTIQGAFACRTGDRIVARFTIASYAISAIGLVDSKDTVFTDIHSYSAPSTTIMLQSGNENLYVDNLIIKTKEDSPMLWGSNVDGIWMQELRGELTVLNSKFIGMGDDSLNVHSRPSRIESVTGDSVVLINPYNGSVFVEGWGRKGDSLKMYNEQFEVVATASIKSIDRSTGKYELDNIKGQLKEGLIVQDMELTPKVTVDNCIVNGGRARAFLIQTSNVDIKNCTIKNLALSAIIIAPDLLVWNEMGPAENVKISNCHIENVCLRQTDANYGAIMVKASHDGNGQIYTSIHKDLTFENNTFENTNGKPAIYVTATDKIVIKENNYGDNVKMPVLVNCTEAETDY